ncbi:MAG: cytidine deaminase [Chthonomonadales bacterium]
MGASYTALEALPQPWEGHEGVAVLDDAQLTALVAAAGLARRQAYAPYSGFAVGAAAVSADGRVFLGCNVENASYGLSMCAERNALAAAVAGGAQQLVAIVIVSDAVEPSTPCGACRQWMAELGSKNMEVVAANLNGEVHRYELERLFPHPFRLGNKKQPEP